MSEKKNRFWLKTTILFLLVILTYQQSNYIKNSNFTQSGCTPSASSTCTVSNAFSDSSWTISAFPSGGAATTTVLVNAKTTRSQSPDPNQNAVWMVDASNTKKPICLTQTIPSLPSGTYIFPYYLFVTTDNIDPTLQRPTVKITDSSQSTTIYTNSLSFSKDGGQLSPQPVVRVRNFYSGAKLKICNEAVTDYGFYIRDFELIRQNDACDAATSSSQSLTDGTTACIPHAVVLNSFNCYKYKRNADGSYECGSCDTVSTTPNLVNLATSPYKGCAQMLIPGVATYKLSADSSVVDSSGKIYLISNSCSGVTGTIPVSIPSFSAANKDQTEFACRSDFANVAAWQVVNGAYVAASCDANYLLINLVSSSQSKGCIDSTTPALQYDADCLTYKYASPSYTCLSCRTSYTPRNVTIGGTTVVDCLLDTSQIIPYCNSYTKIDDTDATFYYCATGQCTGGAVQIPAMGTDAQNGIGCTKLQTFPYGPFGACDVYERITSSTTYLTCDTCSGTLEPKFCKTDTDYCDDNNIAGVQVTVNGVPQQCALSGFINNCIDYTELRTDKSLTACKTCRTGYFAGTSVTGSSICIPLPSIPSCKLYYANGTCSTCVSGLPYDIVNQKCPSSAAEMISNCKSAIFLNGVYICTSCMQGFTLDTSNATTKCNQAVQYCSTYTSTKPAVCALCVSGYILFNNTCVKQSIQCTAVDSKGLCVQCAAGYKVQNGTCVQVVSCTSSQYVNSKGVCQQGNVSNCQSYSSPNGQCTSCKSGYAFNQNLQCMQSSLTCPPSTTTTKFISNGTACIETDINCLITRNDGYCSECNSGYYQNGGKCYLVANNQVEVSQSVDEFTNLLTDQFGYKYMLNKDGSRSYVTGPWIGLDVWVDQKGNLYIKNANGSRGYLTGLLQSRVAYQDSNGYWYANNPDGSRLYYTGPYAGKSVFADNNGYFYSLNDDGSRYYITGPYQGKNVFADNDGYFYVQNSEGSITYLNGPYQGKTLFRGPDNYLYTKNADGSRSYINGPWVGQFVFVDQEGRLYTKNLSNNSITFLTGPYSGKTAYFDPSRYLYVQNTDGSRTYLTGPNANRTLFIDNAGFYYYLNPDGSRTYVTGPFSGKIIFSDPSGFLYYEPYPGTRTYITGPYAGRQIQVQPVTNYLYSLNPDGSRTYLTGPSAQQTIYPDTNGYQYTLNPDGSRFYLTGPYANKTVFSDNLGNLYTKNPDGSITYLTGPNTGKIVFTDNTGSYILNPNGSRTYLTGPNTGKIVFSEPSGNLYVNNPDGTRTYLNGPNSGATVYSSPSGNQFIKNTDGTIKYLTGPYVGKTVYVSPDGHEFIKNPDGTITYLTGPNANKTIFIDPTTELEYLKNPDGKRKYLADPTTTELPKPSAQDIINNLIDGNAKIVTSGSNSYIVYKDPTGKTYAVVADQTYPDGIVFTDSTGNKYFIANTPGAQPLPVQVGANGSNYVINSDGTMKYLTTTSSPSTTIPTLPSTTNPVSPSTNNTSSSPSTNPSTSNGTTTTSTLTDPNGYKYELINGQKRYLSGPWAGKTTYVDSLGNQYLINPDGTRLYISGPCRGYTVYQDQSGNWYFILPNGARSYTTGPYTGRQLYPDQNGFLYELNLDKTRKYITGPNAGKTVKADIDGYIYTMNTDGTATYTTGPYTGMIIQKDSQGNFYRSNLDGTKTYVTGPNAGKTSFIDSTGQSYNLNPDGSRTYLTGPYTSKTYFVDPNGNLYTLSTDNQRTYVTGQNSGKTVYIDLTGASYTQNVNGTRTYTSGQFAGQTVFADPQQYFYTLNSNGSRKYLSGPMAGKTIYVDSMGILYLLNQDGSRTYLTGALSGKTVNASDFGSSLPVTQTPLMDSTSLSFILRDDTGTFVLDPKGERRYLSLVPNSSPSQQVYSDQSGLNYFVYTDLNGNKYTKNGDGSKTYLTGFSDNTLSTYVVRVDKQGNNFAIYSDTLGNRYTVYNDSNGSKYYLNSDGSKKYLTKTSPVNSILSSVVDPNTQYKLYTDASGNVYVVYTDAQGRPYTILPDKTKKYLEAPAQQPTGTIVFQDNMCEKFVLDADGSRNYLIIDTTGQQGANFISYVDQNGNKYRVYTDPNGNKYTLNENGSKSYLTGFTSQPENNYKIYTDSLGTQFTVYTLPNGDSFIAYQYSNDKSKYYFDINCRPTQLNTGASGTLNTTSGSLPINTGSSTNTGTSSTQQSSYNWFNVVLTDDAGNKYLLNSDKTWNYLSLAPGSSSGSNPATYRDFNGGYFMVYLDSTTGNRYVKNSETVKTYLTGFPTSTSGSPLTFTDSLNNTYAVYSDAQGNKYVTYNDAKGKYYLNANGSKTYLTASQLGTTATINNSTNTQTNQVSTNISTTVKNTTSQTTQVPVPNSPQVYVFMDPSGNKYILNSTSMQRIYLHPVSQSGNSYTYADSSNTKYILYKDTQTGRWYYNLNTNIKEFITGNAPSIVGQPVTLTDSVGTIHTISTDSQGNKYVTYTDQTGKYYFNNDGVPVYLNKSNLSTDDGKTSSLWNLVNSLQNMLAQCQGSMFK